MEEVFCPKCNSEDVYFSKKKQLYVCEDCEHRFSIDVESLQEKPEKTLSLFFSYGHDSNEELVFRLKQDLEKRGHIIWIDKQKIKSGHNWRQSILEGISNSESVLAFLSKHSVRDPGVCRDELQIALCKDAVINTILLENENEVSVPASVADVQWLDMQNWKKIKEKDEWNKWYNEKLTELCKVIESKKNIAFAGELEEIRKVFNPTTSDSKEKRLNEQQFFGREWISDEINKWRMFDSSSKLLAMFGGPGTGKSRFIAHELHYNPNILCSVFCEWDKQDFNNAKNIVIQLIFKLSCKLGDYRKKLLDIIRVRTLGESSINIEKLSAVSLMDEFLIHPLASAIDGGREVQFIVIDGLDEADENGENILIDVITRCMDMLPKWIKFIVTSRPEKNILNVLENYNPKILNIESQENDNDISTYLNAELQDELLDHGNVDHIVKKIIEKSEGAFLYITLFIQGIKDHSISLADEGSYPNGIGGFYMKNFQRQFKDFDEFKEIRKFLELIIASQNLPVDILLKVLDQDNYDLNNFETLTGSLVKISEQNLAYLNKKLKVINLHHKSLADWLNSTKSGKYFTDKKIGGKRLALFANQEIGENKEITDDKTDFSISYFKHNITDFYCVAELWNEMENFLLEKNTPLDPYWLSIEKIPENADDKIKIGLENHIRICYNKLEKDHNFQPFVELLRFFEELSQQRYISILINFLGEINLNKYLQNTASDNDFTEASDFHPQKLNIGYSISVIITNCKKNNIIIPQDITTKLEDIKISCLYLNGKINGKDNSEIEIKDLHSIYKNYGHLLNYNNCNIPFNGENPGEDILKHKKLYNHFNTFCLAFEINHGINYMNVNILKTLGVDVKSAIQLALELIKAENNGKEINKDTFVFSNIARMYISTGDFQEALSWYKKVLDIQENILGKEHLDTATTYENIAYAENECGNYDESFKWYEKALKIRKSKLGKEHPSIGSIYHNIGKLVGDQGREDLAIDWDLKALKIREKYLGKDHPETANTYNNLGFSYEYLGQYEKALEMNFKSLAAKEKSLRKDHPHIGMTYACIASVYEKQGKYFESLELYKKALEIRENALGKKHPFTARTYNSLGKIYRLCGDYKAALANLNKAREIREEVYGNTHSETAIVYHRIGKVYFEQQKFDEALEMFEMALNIRMNSLSDQNPDIAKNLNDIASIYSTKGEFEKSAELYSKALNMQINLFGKEHIFCASILENQADDNLIQKKYNIAFELLKEALKLKEDFLGTDHPETAVTYYKLAEYYRLTDDNIRAKEYYIKSFDIQKKMLGEKHPFTVKIYTAIKNTN